MSDKSKEKEPKKEEENNQKEDKLKKTGSDEDDIDILKKYGRGPYTEKIRNIEDEVKTLTKDVNKLCGIKESETGLSLPSNWVKIADKKAINEDCLMVGRIIKIADSFGVVSSYEYISDCCPNILRMKDSLGAHLECYYNDNYQLIKTIDENAIQVLYYYDEAGNRIKADTVMGDNVLGNYEESFKNGYINQKVNFLGGISHFDYNVAAGIRNSVTNPVGATTNYVFDLNSGLLTDVSCCNSSISYGYSANKLSSLSHNIDSSNSNTVLYSFEYDEFGEKTTVGVGCYNLVSYLYNENNGCLKKLEFSNGQYLEPFYESYGKISELRYNGITAYKFFYGKAGEVGLIIDYENDISWIYEYNDRNQIIRINGSDGKVFQFTYDQHTGNVFSYDFFDEQRGTNSNEMHIEYYYQLPDKTDTVSAMNINQGDLTIEYSYDSFRRVEKTAKLRSGVCLTTAFSYVENQNNRHTSLIPDTIIQTVLSEEKSTIEQRSIHNTYDLDGSISTVYENDVAMIKYYYDYLGQVIREDNVYLEKTITYEYDFGGNIQKKTQYYYTNDLDLGSHDVILSENYYYDDEQWRDKLTAVGGKSIIYDEMGNPEKYYNGFSFNWGQGRKLTRAKKDNLNVVFSYNESGYCISKNVNGIDHEYLLLDNQVIMETNGQDKIWYYYDEDSSPTAFKLNDEYYIYLKNLQGDIVGIINSKGMQLVKYAYDVWGKVITVSLSGDPAAETLSRINPYLYRGYRFDFDLGLYNLNSRFYDPETGRFINADSRVSTFQGVLSYNMYTYCLNNPVNMLDPSGNAAILMNDFTSTGNSIVGHSQVFIQDSEGEYSFTEFTKINGTPKVLTCWVGATYFSNSPYTLIEMLVAVLLEETLSGKDYVFIPGNFTSSVNYAYSYNNQTSTEHGSYDLLTNNCVHYAKDVLRQGTASSTAVESVITNSSAFITGTLISQIRNAMQ